MNQHPHADIITSFPGLGVLTGARVLAEIGDDRSRFHDAKALKACVGAAPATRASGKTIAVSHRRVKSQRPGRRWYIWAFAALTAPPGASGPPASTATKTSHSPTSPSRHAPSQLDN